jgi:hypothetical protein
MARYYRALIDLVFERGAGVPLSVVKKAVALAHRPIATDESFYVNDQVWAVFDRNDHPNFAQAVNKAEAAGISVAYSNPCFELWVVLHYQDHDRPVRRDEIQKVLRELMRGYDPDRSKHLAFDDICGAVERAEKRAETLERRRAEERNPRGNPSTSVFRLSQEIRKYGRS